LTRGPFPWLREGSAVGLPRALLYYELYPFWRGFFEELGFRVVDSGPTSREVLEAGVREAVDEACLPVKAFYGHVVSLRDRVDAVFLPRLVSLERGTYTCPKLLGLPDMVRHNISRLPPAIIADFDETRPGKGLKEAAVRLARRLGRGARLARAAVARGLESLALFRKALWSGLWFESAVQEARRAEGRGGVMRPRAAGRPVSGLQAPGRRAPEPAARRAGRLRVGLVGHSYNLFDPGVNLGLCEKLRRLGCDIVTSESLSEEEVRAESVKMPKEIFWSSGRRVLAAVSRFRREGLVDGIIHIESFGCGPESMVGEIAERETRRRSRMPYMVLTVDEHTGEAGLLTRLEAFVDLIERRRDGRGGRGREEAG